MRKTFKLFCAAALAALAVSSCGKIEDQFAQIESELESITARLDKLEAALNADVANLATLDANHSALDKAVKDLEAALEDAIAAGDKTNSDAIKALQEQVATLQAQLAGVKVEAKDGAIVVTIGKNSFTLSQNGVITIVEKDGVKYWAIVDPASGEVTNLEVKVGHDLKFKVDPETAEVLVCYDGDKYVGTGVYAAASSATLIGDVEETDDAVTITIGDATYTLAKWADDKSVLGLSRSDFFLMYGATKVVELTAEDITEYYVMAKPDGWKANLDGKTLTVVAPTQKAYEVGAAEAEGEILIHATTVEGKCKVAKLDVKTGLGLTIDVDASGNVTITNSYASEQVDMLTGEKVYGFDNFYIGFDSNVANFTEDPKDYMANLFDNWDATYGLYYNNYDIEFKPYVEVEYETDVLTSTAADIFEWLTYSELPYATNYVIWVAPADESGYPMSDAVQYVTYTRFDLDVQITELSHKDAKLVMDLKGATAFYAGILPTYPNVSMETVFSEGGLWMYLKEGYMKFYDGPAFEDGEDQVVTLSELNWGDPLAFNTKYYVYVFPYVEGTEYTDFDTQFAPYVMEVTTNDLQAGGAYKVTLGEEVVGYDYISVPVTIAEGTESVYYAWYTPEDYAEFENDAEVRAALFEDCYFPLSVDDEEISESYLEPGESWVLATVSVGADGKYGEVVSKTYKTLAVPYDENISATLESLTLVDGVYTAVFSVKGATKVVGNNMSTIYNEDGTIDEESEAGNLAYAVKNIVSKPGVYYAYQWVDVVDGKATVTFNSSSYKKDYYVWGYNVDEDGAVIGLQATPLVFNLAKNLPAAE